MRSHHVNQAHAVQAPPSPDAKAAPTRRPLANPPDASATTRRVPLLAVMASSTAKVRSPRGNRPAPNSVASDATAASGAAPTVPAAKYETYVQRGPGYAGYAGQAALLSKKVALLNQKLTLFAQACPNAPDTRALDEQLAKLDAQLPQPK